MRIQVGHFEPDGALIYLPVGFVPDYFFMAEHGGGAAAIVMYHWWEQMEDDEASGSQEGFSVSEGTTALLADDGGIVAYDTGSGAPSISAWTASTSATARSATADGTLVRATTSGTDDQGLVVDREAIFECVTAGTTGNTEPTWPSQNGDNTASDNGVVWQKVADQPIRRAGYQGVRIAAALMTNGQEMYYLALHAGGDKYDHGDVDGWSGGVKDA